MSNAARAPVYSTCSDAFLRYGVEAGTLLDGETLDANVGSTLGMNNLNYALLFHSLASPDVLENWNRL
jgi:hypothetical protein